MKKILAFLTLALAAALPAVAAAGVRIARVDASGYPTVRVTVITSSPSAKTPLLREDGMPVEGLTAENLAHGANVVLAIDRSLSMKGHPLADATAAARTFIDGKPYSTNVELVAFGHRAVELTGMTQSTIDADQALRTVNVDLKQGTALWDAVAVASSALAAQESGGRVLVLLTDGSDTMRTTTLDRAIAAARNAGVAVYPIDAGSAEQLLSAADADLLRAKQRRHQALTGRARPRVAEEAAPPH